MAGIWGVFILVFLTGVTVTAYFEQASERPNQTVTYAKAQVGPFLAYKNACVAYAVANPTFLGTIPTSGLNLPAGAMVPSGIKNSVSAQGSGRLVMVWGALPSPTTFYAVKGLGGDMSIGMVQNGKWVSPVYGVLGVAPAGIPNGDILGQAHIGG